VSDGAMDDLLERLDGAIPATQDMRDTFLAELLLDAIREIERLRASEGWHPIAAAPRDGTRILVAIPCGKMTVARWDSFGDVEGWFSYLVKDTGRGIVLTGETSPTHWRHLPPPPDCEANPPPSGTA